MNVLHIVAGDLNGGAARGAYWLHRGLRDIGVNSHLLTNSHDTHGDDSVSSVCVGRRGRVIGMVRAQLDVLPAELYRHKAPGYFSTGLVGIDFLQSAAYRAADIIHLHWINGGLVNLRHLARIDKPVIWTLRDMWPMTGGCHYTMGCERFTSACGECKHLASRSKVDLSHLLWRRKRKYLPKALKLVGISDWLSGEARRSGLFKHHDVRTISNAVDLSAFFPLDKRVARNLLGLDTDKTIVLCGSTNARDPYKGFGHYLDALNELDPARYHLCFFGKLEARIAETLALRFDCTSFGFLHDEVSLRLVYSAADMFVAPSVMEAFGKTLVEAMACGTPVVCFGATGPKDIVTHRHDGFAADPFDPVSLAEGIDWIARHEDYRTLRQRAIEKVRERFDTRVIARQYQQLYQEVMVPHLPQAFDVVRSAPDMRIPNG
ncbi:glycosyltransferase family 4 protein [Pseudomonas sp. Marseille-QA0892]